MVIDQLYADGTIFNTNAPKVIKPLIVPMTPEQKGEYDALEVLDVSIEQAEYI